MLKWLELWVAMRLFGHSARVDRIAKWLVNRASGEPRPADGKSGHE